MSRKNRNVAQFIRTTAGPGRRALVGAGDADKDRAEAALAAIDLTLLRGNEKRIYAQAEHYAKAKGLRKKDRDDFLGLVYWALLADRPADPHG